MKKAGKISLILGLVCAFAAATVSLSACFSVRSYTGEYSYESWNTNYGIRVSVAVQSDKKGDRIRSVEVVPSDYVEASVTDSWDKSVWEKGQDGLLLSYRGRYLADVLVSKVECEGQAPVSVADDSLVISGATVSSGRLLLAVQNALTEAAEALGYRVAEGEYSYTSWGTNYGIKTKVVVKDGTVMAVGVVPSDYVEASVTDSWDKSVWENGLDGLLSAYQGKTVEEINAVRVTLDGDAPGAVDDGTYVITGATVGSGRLLLAVQNALAKLS